MAVGESGAIRIFKYKGFWNFVSSVGYVKSKFLERKKFMKCHFCGADLSATYAEVMLKLKKANMLHEDFKPVCCFCWIIKNEFDRVLEIVKDYDDIIWIKVKGHYLSKPYTIENLREMGMYHLFRGSEKVNCGLLYRKEELKKYGKKE